MSAVTSPPSAEALEDWLDRELADCPTLGPAELRSLSERIGHEERLWRAHVRHVEHDRFTKLLHRRERLDVWLLCWLDVQETGLHDHDHSAGAFYVCDGELAEDVVRFDESGTLQIESRYACPGTSRGFDASHIHGVRHTGSQPATSIHVYSPALSAMGHYEIGEDGGLQRVVRTYADGALEP